MLSEKLEKALNDQINYEYYSAYTYLAMSAYADDLGFVGVANFFQVQAKEELDHAKTIYNFVMQKGGKIELEAIEKPKSTYDGLLDVFETALEHEKEVTSRIYNLMNIATDEREYATTSFLKWFIDEQVEEEDNFTNIVRKIKTFSSDSSNLYLIDNQLASRVYTPSVPASSQNA
ncbi:ferritin [Peptostreptococcus faecalis]|uniref:ferritin n=1 Tax=Peptostreptococcus faecalis TaxID=2045015 RepID=UPI000C7D022A|nr:ferritin [Peptostreptococcus faecalis]